VSDPIPDRPSNPPEPEALLALIRQHASRGEPGLAFIASLVDQFKRERDRAEALAGAYLTEITRLNKQKSAGQPEPAPGLEPSDRALARDLKRANAPSARPVLSLENLDV